MSAADDSIDLEALATLRPDLIVGSNFSEDQLDIYDDDVRDAVARIAPRPRVLARYVDAVAALRAAAAAKPGCFSFCAPRSVDRHPCFPFGLTICHAAA